MTVGPSNWFEVSHPPQWKSEGDHSTLQLTSSDGRVWLTLHCVWLKSNDEDVPESIEGLEKLFPVRRNVHAIPALKIDYPSLGLEGEAILGPETPWWQRVLSHQDWRRWRVWAIRYRTLRLIAIYFQEGEFDPESDTLVRMILESIEFAAHPAEPMDVFAQRALKLAEEIFPDVSIRIENHDSLKLGESTVNLANFYRSYLAAPERFREILEPVLNAFKEVQGWGESKLTPTLDAVRDRIMPMLYPEHVWQNQFKNFVGQQWVAQLLVLYVVDEPQAYWFIRDELLASWKISPDELHDIAMANLETYFENKPMEFAVTGQEMGPRLLLPQRPDAYNTVRLLSSNFQESLREVLGNEFVVGMPNRDFFVAVSMGSDEMIEQIQQKVLQDFGRMDHPLCNKLLLVSQDGVSQYLSE